MISGFMERDRFAAQREKLRAVALMGGAHPAGMDTRRMALRDALPFVESWGFKDEIDPAFVPCLGAALRVRHNRLSH